MNIQRTTITKPNSFTLFLSTTIFFFFLPILLFKCTTSAKDARHSSPCATILSLKFAISSAFVLASSINEASFTFTFSFSWTYRINSLPFAETLLPASISTIHWKNLQELDSYNTIPIKHSKIQNKTQNWHFLTFQCMISKTFFPDGSYYATWT